MRRYPALVRYHVDISKSPDTSVTFPLFPGAIAPLFFIHNTCIVWEIDEMDALKFASIIFTMFLKLRSFWWPRNFIITFFKEFSSWLLDIVNWGFKNITFHEYFLMSGLTKTPFNFDSDVVQTYMKGTNAPL